MSEPVFEPCPSEWTNECGHAEAHNYCWPEPLVNCCPELAITEATPQATIDIINQSKRVAVQILHAFSGRQFGLCRRVVRPCLDDCRQNGSVATTWVDGQLQPTLDSGIWYNRDVCGKCSTTGCGCSDICEVTLPGLVQSIVSVTVDGVTLPSDEYRVDNHRKLVRQYVTQTLVGPARLFTAALAGNDPANRWCDLTPVPDSTIGTGPVEPGGCYPSTLNNPTFVWNSVGTVTATYDAASPDSTVASFTDPTGAEFYDFSAIPANQVIAVGVPVTSALNSEGQAMRFTVVSGVVRKHAFTDYGFDIDPGAVIQIVRTEQAAACWPKCQELSKPLGQPGTFGVTYLRGVPVPEAGRWAAGMLACELVKACLPELGECRLPDNVTSVVREGVTLELAPFIIGGADGQIQFGRTGIPEVDLWLIAVNPHKIRTRSRAYSPDRPNPRRTTFP